MVSEVIEKVGEVGRICDKTEDVDPIICTGATCKQPICTEAKPRYRFVVCRGEIQVICNRLINLALNYM